MGLQAQKVILILITPGRVGQTDTCQLYAKPPILWAGCPPSTEAFEKELYHGY